MRDAIQLVGFIMTLQGISGAIDHLAVQPFMGMLLNFFNRVVIPRVDVLAGHALIANMALAVLGVVVMAAGDRSQPSGALQPPTPPQPPPPAPSPPAPLPPAPSPPTQPAVADHRRGILLQAARFAAIVAGWVVAGAAAAVLFADDGLTRARVVRSAAAVALAFVLALAVGAFQARHRGRG
jgi:hypothetical protein